MMAYEGSEVFSRAIGDISPTLQPLNAEVLLNLRRGSPSVLVTGSVGSSRVSQWKKSQKG